MSTSYVAVQPEHVTDKEYIGILLAQIKAQQETYNILYNRNLVLYNELKTMNAYAMQLQTMQDLTESHGRMVELWKVTEGKKIIASDRQENDCSQDEIKALNLQDGTDVVLAKPWTLPPGQLGEEALTPAELRQLMAGALKTHAEGLSGHAEIIKDLALSVKQLTSHSSTFNREMMELNTCDRAVPHVASALEALKTLAKNRGLQLRCEDERVSEQEWRARFVFITSEGHEKELPWSSVCLGLKRAKQAAAEVALDYTHSSSQ
jgi:hypothetical protein